jgi:hypothetical protein
MPADTVQEESLPKGRLILGIVIVLVGQAAPFFVPLVVKSGLPTEWKTALSGVLAFGFPNLTIFAVVVLLGKSGYAAIKKKIFGWLKRSFAPSDVVGKLRYTIGLIMFCVPVFMAWIGVYLTKVAAVEWIYTVEWALISDATIIVSLFVLGGDFWDKIRSLFVRRAKAVFPNN